MIEVNAFNSEEDVKEFLNKKAIDLYNNKFFNILNEENKEILITKLIKPLETGNAKVIFLEGERKSGITSILKAFMLYAYIKGSVVFYITGKDDNEERVKREFYEEYSSDVIYTLHWNKFKNDLFNSLNTERIYSKFNYKNTLLVFDDISPLEIKETIERSYYIFNCTDCIMVSGYTYDTNILKKEL